MIGCLWSRDESLNQLVPQLKRAGDANDRTKRNFLRYVSHFDNPNKLLVSSDNRNAISYDSEQLGVERGTGMFGLTKFNCTVDRHNDN